MKQGDKIARLRTEAGLDQVQLGHRIGVSGATVSRYESGRIIPPKDKNVEMSKVFGVNIGWFVDDNKDWPPVKSYQIDITDEDEVNELINLLLRVPESKRALVKSLLMEFVSK